MLEWFFILLWIKPRNVQYCLINAYFHDLGIQQAPAIGRAIAELIYDDDFQTIDLTRFLFDRMLNDVRMMEAAIVWIQIVQYTN